MIRAHHSAHILPQRESVHLPFLQQQLHDETRLVLTLEIRTEQNTWKFHTTHGNATGTEDKVAELLRGWENVEDLCGNLSNFLAAYQQTLSYLEPCNDVEDDKIVETSQRRAKL